MARTNIVHEQTPQHIYKVEALTPGSMYQYHESYYMRLHEWDSSKPWHSVNLNTGMLTSFDKSFEVRLVNDLRVTRK